MSGTSIGSNTHIAKDLLLWSPNSLMSFLLRMLGVNVLRSMGVLVIVRDATKVISKISLLSFAPRAPPAKNRSFLRKISEHCISRRVGLLLLTSLRLITLSVVNILRLNEFLLTEGADTT